MNEPGSTYGGQTDWDAQGPYIKFNMAIIRRMPAHAILFLKAHEYGHVNLRHTRDRWSPAVAGRFEAEADCWAGQQLYASDPQILQSILTMLDQMGNTGGDWSHGTGAQVAAVIRSCIQRPPSDPPDETQNTLEPLSITEHLKEPPCTIKEDDFRIPSGITTNSFNQMLPELRRLRDRALELKSSIEDDSANRAAIRAEERANERLEFANDYTGPLGSRSPFRDRAALDARRRARQAVREANRAYRDKIKLCQEAAMIRVTIANIIENVTDNSARRAANSQGCQINGQTVDLLGTTWTMTTGGGRVFSLTFGANGNLTYDRYYRNLNAERTTRNTTWRCENSRLYIRVQWTTVSSEEEYELGFEDGRLYTITPNQPSLRAMVFTRQN